MQTAVSSEEATSEGNVFARLRSCSKELYTLDTRPLIDSSFIFPWEDFAEAFHKLFHVECSFSLGTIQWTGTNEIEKGIIAPIVSIPVALPNIAGQIELLVSQSDIERLLHRSLDVNVSVLRSQDPAFFDQFSQFACASIVACVSSLSTLRDLSPTLTNHVPYPTPGSLTVDINITLAGEQGLCRLVVPPDFLQAWKTARLPTSKKSHGLGDVPVPIVVEGGRTFLSAKELQDIKEGDFLRLDHPFFIPDSQKSRVFLTHRGIPLFRAKVQEGNIKILEMPLQHEAFLPPGGQSMTARKSFEETQTTEEPTISTSGEEATKDPVEWEEEDTTDTSSVASLAENSGISDALAGKPLDINQIPLTVVIELTELNMSIEKLTSLQPGNLLDLDIRPENGVSLVVNGHVIGQGELMLIGDNVGVRITKIGFTSEPQKK